MIDSVTSGKAPEVYLTEDAIRLWQRRSSLPPTTTTFSSGTISTTYRGDLRANSQALALAYREGLDSVVVTQDVPGSVQDKAGVSLYVLSDEASIVAIGDKADVLAVGLIRIGKLKLAGGLPDLRLWVTLRWEKADIPAPSGPGRRERSSGPCPGLGRGGDGIRGAEPVDAGVVSRGQLLGTQGSRFFDEKPELYMVVAGDAGVRGPTSTVLVDEVLDYVCMELLFEVEDVVGDVQHSADPLGVTGVLSVAARLVASRVIGVLGGGEAHGDADDIVAGVLELGRRQQRSPTPPLMAMTTLPLAG